MGLVQTRTGNYGDKKQVTMVQNQQYRFTHQVPLVQLETFCRSVQNALCTTHGDAELLQIWELYVSAECPGCGIRICGKELRALALAPCAELASEKTGRMRLGYCARCGCEAWHYSVQFCSHEGIDWPQLLEKAEKPGEDAGTSNRVRHRPWFTRLGSPAFGYTARGAATLGLLLVLWLARELYLGGRIPFLREPEKFKIETRSFDNTWPAPMDVSDGPIH
jgi:hypothetical protein